jgi:DNA-binding XRE family transcriptional regulator
MDSPAQKLKTNEKLPPEVLDRIYTYRMSPARAWREHLGLTQAEIARRVDLTQMDYALCEGGRSIQRPLSEKIAAALGISADMLNV